MKLPDLRRCGTRIHGNVPLSGGFCLHHFPITCRFEKFRTIIVNGTGTTFVLTHLFGSGTLESVTAHRMRCVLNCGPFTVDAICKSKCSCPPLCKTCTKGIIKTIPMKVRAFRGRSRPCFPVRGGYACGRV